MLPSIPRCLFLGSNDWANCCGRVARAMNATAAALAGPAARVARVWTYNAHPSGYAEDAVGESPPDNLRAWVQDQPPDWILTTGDGGVQHTVRMRDALGIAPTTRVAALQVGSYCRQNPAGARVRDEEIGARVFFPGADLLRFYRDEDRAVPFLAPCEPRAANDGIGQRRGVSHSPSNRESKGTIHILPIVQDVCARADVPFDVIEGVTDSEARRRRAALSIFVDQFNFHVGGFGQAVTDALVDGCCIVSHVAHLIPEVDGFYPRPPIVHVESEAHLREHLRRLLAEPEELAWRQRASRAWAREVASPEAVARYWWRHLARWA